MNLERIKKVADAVLYEGHMLYPYRPSSVKNQQPFTFGTLAPGASMQTECLLEGDESTTVDITVRFLQGAKERSVVVARVSGPCAHTFSYGLIEGEIQARRESLEAGLFKQTVRVLNTTSPGPPEAEVSMASTHAILAVQRGKFVSAIDPPERLKEQAAQCRNIGVWPVLAGEAGSHDCMLASPIILYDYPEIAPESPGELFDGTEIDEILTLRIMTMTDAEKDEMRQGDERTRRILERVESLAPEELMRLHGALRNPHAFGVELKRGDRVRLWPQKRADIMDIALTGKIAEIESIERDFDNQVHLAVILDDDPGRDLGELRQPGHRFFFTPDEVEPLGLDAEIPGAANV